jgi:hypothetical protein
MVTLTQINDIEINPQIKSAYITNIGDFRGMVNVIKYEDKDYNYIQVGNKLIDITVNPLLLKYT